MGTATLDTVYFASNLCEPDDIKWDVGMAFNPTSTAHTITIVGLRLNSKGVIHGTAIKPGKRKLFYSTQSAPSSSVRYLEDVEDPDEQMRLDLEFLQNSGDDLFNGQNQRFLQQSSNVVCQTAQLNELTITCSGADLIATSNTRDDIASYNNPPFPSSYTLSRECDGSGFKGDGIGRVTTKVFLNFFF